MKIIIYGVGKMFQQYAKFIDFSDVTYLVDQVMGYQPLYGKKFIGIDAIKNQEFDYVVIFNKYECDKVRKNLIENGVAGDKILSWIEYLFDFVFKFHGYASEYANDITKKVNELGIKTLLDIDHSIVENGLHIQNRRFTEKIDLLYDVEISGVPLLDRRPYDRIFYDVVDYYFDAVLALNYFENHTYEEWNLLIKKLEKTIKYAVVAFPYPGMKANDSSWDSICLDDRCEHVIKGDFCGIAFIKISDKVDESDNIGVYVVTHCDFEKPENDIYIPIQVGNNNISSDYIKDSTDENIAHLNTYINECTALYWMWKNSDKDIIGLNHYRRFFINEQKELLNSSDIKKYLLDADIIVTEPSYVKQSSLYHQIETTVDTKIFEKVYDELRNAISDKYPEYAEEFETYFKGHFMYPRNMFIMKKNILDSFCEWLFDIILTVLEKVGCSAFDELDAYSKRTVGFFAERLLGLWILHNNITVKECPFILVK